MTGVLVISIVFAAVGARLCWKRFAEKLAYLAGVFLLLVALAGIAAWFLWNLFAQVFTLHGLAYSFGFAGVEWGDSTLAWPTAVRVTTLLLTLELAALMSFVVQRRHGRERDTFVGSWAWAHLALVAGLASVLAWYIVLAPGTAIAAKCQGSGFVWPERQRGSGMANVAVRLLEDICAGLVVVWVCGLSLAVRAFGWAYVS